ncbi:MAG TPA: carotenoid biosynthesis protein [Smithellaceae bacterium]|nr:carotenoid biosynthesis protein [Smithellaceae bacterium]
MNKKVLYALFSIVLLSIYLNLVWDAARLTSPFYYNMIMGALFTLFALLHGDSYVGRKSTITLATLTFVISFIMEYAGVKTGMIFGEYHYGDVLGPKALETVPWLIPLSWFMFMYVSTITVDAAFGRRHIGWAAPALFAVLDAMAMTALDILIDPLWVTRGTWVWTAVHTLSASSVFYGIPTQNYFGWLLTTMMIFIPYRIVFFRNRSILAERDRDFFLPCLIYASIVAVGCVESFVFLSNTGVLFVALMTGGALSIASLIGFMAWCGQNTIQN